MNNVATVARDMAIPNCDWFEVLAFNRAGHHGLEHLELRAGRAAGHRRRRLHPRADGPGLGVGVDWELIESARIGEIQ